MANQHPSAPTAKQAAAFDVLLGEREYQVKTHGDSPVPSLVDFANLLIEYTDKLAVDVQVDPTGGVSPAGGPLKRLREIAAIALHGMEAHGVQPRENHVPASAGITGTLKVVTGPDTTKPKPVAAAPEHREAPPPTPTDVHHETSPLPHHTPGGEHSTK